MHRITVILLATLGVLWAASGQAATWTDAMGRSVEIAGTPQRIVSLVPSVTEILYELGADDRLVGVTRFCTYPAQAADKAQVGDYADPNLEAVALLEPDLVFLAADTANPALVARIESLGIAAYIVYPRGIEATIATISAIGAVVGAAEAGEQVARQLQLALERTRASVEGGQRPGVVFCIMTQPLMVAGPGTLIDDLIRLAGGRNLVPAGPSRYPTWGIEALLAADPDIIVLSSHPDQGEPGGALSGWSELHAVRRGQIVSVEPDWVSRPGPRLALGAAALAEIFGRAELQSEATGR